MINDVKSSDCSSLNFCCLYSAKLIHTESHRKSKREQFRLNGNRIRTFYFWWYLLLEIYSWTCLKLRYLEKYTKYVARIYYNIHILQEIWICSNDALLFQRSRRGSKDLLIAEKKYIRSLVFLRKNLCVHDLNNWTHINIFRVGFIMSSFTYIFIRFYWNTIFWWGVLHSY